MTMHACDCARLHAAAFAHGWDEAEFERLLAGSPNLGDAACSGSRRLVGFVLSRLAADEAEILTIAIDANQRRRGIGQRLLVAHAGRLTAAGVRKVFLEVDEDNSAALALYGAMGFATVGKRPAYYPKTDGTRGQALVLRCNLG